MTVLNEGREGGVLVTRGGISIVAAPRVVHLVWLPSLSVVQVSAARIVDRFNAATAKQARRCRIRAYLFG
jgi:hypothetical protein